MIRTATHRLLTALLAPCLLAGCGGDGSPPAQSSAPAPDTARTAAQIRDLAWQEIRQGALLIDVRTAAEFAQGHLDGAVNIPHEQIGDGVVRLGADKDRRVVLYCRSGRRSGLAHKTLWDLGYRHVLNAGGYEDLKATRP
ncbi:MAG: rhodanese-like domain-containing protein [Candidatus Latescibacterota bacterium]